MNNDKKSAVISSVAIGIIVFALAIGVAVKKTGEAEMLSNELNDVYTRSVLQVVDSINDVDTALLKGSVTNSPALLSNLSSEIYRQATFAQANLGELPLGNAELDNTSKFLSQVGDFTYSLSNKVLNGGKITDEEKKQMASLSKYASSLSDSLYNIEKRLMNNEISLVSKNNSVSASDKKQTPLSEGLSNVEKDFQEYPSLIYDGPFSDHINKMEAKYTKGKSSVSKEGAEKKIAHFITDTKIQKLTFRGESEGTIKTYLYNGADENNTDFSVEISKMGGDVLYMLKNRNVSSASLTAKDAIKIGSDFLIKNGYNSMKESYYETQNNTITINYAYVQNGITMYPDLIKIKIALDNGEILGFESQGYLMAHEETRNLSEPLISMEDAKLNISKNLKVEKSSLAVIPLDGGKEVLCYEFYGKFNNKNFIVYVNTLTGNEEKILMLMIDEKGTLTI